MATTVELAPLARRGAEALSEGELAGLALALAELVEGDEEALPLCGTKGCGVC